MCCRDLVEMVCLDAELCVMEAELVAKKLESQNSRSSQLHWK